MLDFNLSDLIDCNITVYVCIYIYIYIDMIFLVIWMLLLDFSLVSLIRFTSTIYSSKIIDAGATPRTSIL